MELKGTFCNCYIIYYQTITMGLEWKSGLLPNEDNYIYFLLEQIIGLGKVMTNISHDSHCHTINGVKLIAAYIF